MAVKGSARKETTPSEKYVGFFEGKVIAVNPSREEYEEILGIELSEDSKATEYLGESKNLNPYLRVDIWMEVPKIEKNQKVQFYLEDKVRMNKDETKTQYINEVGVCTWAENESKLPAWFTKRDYRKVKTGEEELYTFLRFWLAGMDFMDSETELVLNWKKLMKGNVSEIKELIDHELSRNVVCMAVVDTVDTENGPKEYQSVYNKAFAYPYLLAKLRLGNYDSPERQEKVLAKEPSKRELHEKIFVVPIIGEYGCKGFYKFADIATYDPAENLVSSDREIDDDGPKY